MKICKALSAEMSDQDLAKRVKYSFGMVLGEKEFRQEQAHFLWKHRLTNLLLHGYGTVCGLDIRLPPDTREHDEVQVTSGTAIDLAGRWVRVVEDQCARIDDWLAQQENAPGPGPAVIYVTLRYTECPTDAVPVPGKACATDENDMMVPSRVLEAAHVEFALTPPLQPGEDHVRRFGELLGSIEVGDDVLSPDDSDRLIELVGQLEHPPVSPPPSPPDGIVRLNRSTACEALRRALVEWVTRVRPGIGGPHSGCDPEVWEEAGILLGRLDITIGADRKVVPGSIVLDQSRRPLLLPTRLLQEWVSCGDLDQPGGGALHDHDDLYAPTDHTHDLGHSHDDYAAADHIHDLDHSHDDYAAADHSHDEYVASDHTHGLDDLSDVDTTTALPANNQVLTYDEPRSRWRPRTPPPCVRRPEDAGQYTLIAAGSFQENGARIWNYNELSALRLLNFEYLLSFKGVERFRVADLQRLIVTGTPYIERDPDKLSLRDAFSFQVVALEALKGVVVRVWNPNPSRGDGPNQTGLIGFLVEISLMGEFQS